MFTFSCDVIVLEMDFFVMFHEPGGSKRTLKTTGTGIECHRHTAQGDMAPMLCGYHVITATA